MTMGIGMTSGQRAVLTWQSGGPTVAINATLAGIIAAVQTHTAPHAPPLQVLGARNGVEGLLAGTDGRTDLIDLSDLDAVALQQLIHTPSAALGTTRHRPSDTEIEEILDLCGAQQVGWLVPIGGNDTAETALRLHAAARQRGTTLSIVAAPKTIDNDLPGMDHCPGYPSIARAVALATRDAAFDTRAMRQLYPIKIIEVMGRNAGWIAATGGLALAANPDLPQPLLCLPERPWSDLPTLATTVQERIARDGYVVMVVPETMRWADGSQVAGDTPDWIDTFGHRYFPGVGNALARQLIATLGVRARYDKPGTIARMAMAAASSVDLAESEAAGRAAVDLALRGGSGVMIGIQRASNNPYQASYTAVPLEQIARAERAFPEEWISADGTSVTDAFTQWITPLLGEPFTPYSVL